jgi:hypothetical protein
MAIYPPFHHSHDDGSPAALQLLLTAIITWELIYQFFHYAIKFCLKKHPEWVFDDSLLSEIVQRKPPQDARPIGANGNIQNGSSNGNSNNNQKDSLLQAKQNLTQRGPSYATSLIHAIYATGRGILHLYSLYNVSNLDQVFIPRSYIIEGITTSRPAGLEGAKTNIIFFSYLSYDLIHILIQYPKLGGIDTIMHHILFGICSVINGTYGILVFPFGWLIVGEFSTIFLNWRWFLLKSGREKGIWIERVNKLFALSFFLTRNVVYSLGMIHLFCVGWNELRSLLKVSGVHVGLLGMTVGCMLLGWGLNAVWGYKILNMVARGGGKKKKI